MLFKRTEYDDDDEERRERKKCKRNYGNTQTWRTLNHNFREKFTPILYSICEFRQEMWRRDSELEKCHLYVVWEEERERN